MLVTSSGKKATNGNIFRANSARNNNRNKGQGLATRTPATSPVTPPLAQGHEAHSISLELAELDLAQRHGLRNIASLRSMGPDMENAAIGGPDEDTAVKESKTPVPPSEDPPMRPSNTPRNSWKDCEDGPDGEDVSSSGPQAASDGVGSGMYTNMPSMRVPSELDEFGPSASTGLISASNSHFAPEGVRPLGAGVPATSFGGDLDERRETSSDSSDGADARFALPGMDNGSGPGPVALDDDDDDDASRIALGGIPLFEIYKATRQIKVQNKALEGCVFFIFVISFTFVFVEMRLTSLAGETTEALLDFFVEEEFVSLDVPGLEGDPFFQKTYRDVKTSEEWWRWALGPLSNGLWSDYENLTDAPRGLPQGDAQNYVLGGSQGGILFRTSRVRPDSCIATFFQTEQMLALGDRECFAAWPRVDEASLDDLLDSDVISTAPYGMALSDVDIPGNDTVGLKARTAFSFTDDIGTSLEGTLLGQMYFDRNQYGRGSFLVDLPVDNANLSSTQTLAQLFLNDWIDVSTRVVSVEFNVYNPSTNVITAVRFFTEFSQTGMIRPSFRFYHINALLWKNLHGGYYVLIAIFLVLLIHLTLRWVNRVLTCTRWSTLLRWQVVFDTVLICLFWSSIIIVSLITQHSDVIRASRFLDTISSDRFTAGIFDNAERMHSVDALCSINLMLATVKLISYLPFKTTRTIWSTLGGAVKDVVVLGVVVLVFWAGFSVGSHLTFGSLGFFDFNRIDRTFGTLMVLMFSGSIEFNAMREVSFTAAPLFYSIYMIFMWGVMLNLFVAIIVLTYERHTQWQANFETWSDLHQGTNAGCIIMSWIEQCQHFLRQRWYSFRCFLLRCWIPKRDVDSKGADGQSSVHGPQQNLNGHDASQASLNGHGATGATGAAGGTGVRGARASNGGDAILEFSNEDAENPPPSSIAATSSAGSSSALNARDSARGKFFPSSARRMFRGSSGRSRREREGANQFARWFGSRRSLVDLDAVRAQIASVQHLPPGERTEALRKLDNPHKKLFKEIFRRHHWRMAVDGFREQLERFRAEAQAESILIKRWRYEFDLQRGGSSQSAQSISDWFKKWWKSLRSSSSTAAVNGNGPAPNQRRSSLARYERFTELIRQEKDLAEHKHRIEKVLRETQVLYQKHRISFNRIMRFTWEHAADDERLMELGIQELKEILCPGCPTECCSKSKIDQRAETLLKSYDFLRRRRAVFIGNRRRLLRVRRIVELSGRPPPVQRAMSANIAPLAPAHDPPNAHAWHAR